MKDTLTGDGLKDSIVSVANTLKSYIPKWEDNPVPLKPGENHAPIILPNGRIGYGNYMGQLGPKSYSHW